MKTKHNNEIELLLQRFENGETTRVEEQHLANMLSKPEYKKQYHNEAALFTYFKKAKQENQPPSFVSQLFNNQYVKVKAETSTVHNWQFITKYAAILIIALSATYYTAQYQQKQQKEKAMLAYIATKKALFIISNEMNNATQNLSKIEDATQETQKFINY